MNFEEDSFHNFNNMHWSLTHDFNAYCTCCNNILEQIARNCLEVIKSLWWQVCFDMVGINLMNLCRHHSPSHSNGSTDVMYEQGAGLENTPEFKLAMRELRGRTRQGAILSLPCLLKLKKKKEKKKRNWSQVNNPAADQRQPYGRKHSLT